LYSSAAGKLQPTGVSIHVRVVCDCFLPVVAELSSENRRPANPKYFVSDLLRKNLPVPGVVDKIFEKTHLGHTN